MATFALSEALMSVLRPTPSSPATERISRIDVTRADLQAAAGPTGRSSLLGFLVGLLPGAGATIASFMAYAAEQRLARNAARAAFGRGSVRGLAAPEAANNAAATGSFVPLLSLGIPGSGTTAILLGAFIAYGVQPGPLLYLNHPEVFWGVIVSMWLGNVVLLVLNLPLIPYIARLITLLGHYLIPLILFFSLTGVYLVSFNPFDMQLMVLIAVCAVGMRFLGFPMAPLLLGFVLGGMIEENLSRALLIHDGSWSFLWQRPLTATIFGASIVLLAVSWYKTRNE